MSHALRKKIISSFLLCSFFGSVLTLSFFTPTIALAQTSGLSSTQGLNSFNGLGSTVIGCTGIGSKISGLFKSAASSGKVSGAVNVTDTKSTTALEAANQRENCLKTLAYVAVDKILKRVTLDTVAWINNGFGGEPFFVRNPGSFFQSIARQEFSPFANLLSSDAARYPYGKAFLRDYTNGISNTFDKTAAYSLSKVVGSANAPLFPTNFARGGWAGWLALGQPQNNPIGFRLVATQALYLAQSKAQADQEKQLNMNRGFLSQQKCVAPRDYDANAPTGDPKSICTRWEVLTPGGLIADQATQSLNLGTQHLINSQSLNASLGAVFDALFNQLVKKGLSSISPSLDFNNQGLNGGSNLKNNIGGPGENGSTSTDVDLYTNFSVSDELNLEEVLILGPRRNPNIPIKKSDLTADKIVTLRDHTRTLIDTEQRYIDVLNKTTEPLNSVIYHLRILDYCVPGPYLDWADDTDQAWDIFSAKLGQQLGESEEAIAKSGAKAQQTIDTISSFTEGIGSLVNLFYDPAGDADAQQQAINSNYEVLGNKYNDWRDYLLSTYRTSRLTAGLDSTSFNAADKSQLNKLGDIIDRSIGDISQIKDLQQEAQENKAKLDMAKKVIRAMCESRQNSCDIFLEADTAKNSDGSKAINVNKETVRICTETKKGIEDSGAPAISICKKYVN